VYRAFHLSIVWNAHVVDLAIGNAGATITTTCAPDVSNPRIVPPPEIGVAPCVNAAASFPRGPGCLARPDRNHRPFLLDNMSPRLRDSIEKEWLKQWKECLGNPSNTPRQVLRSYVDNLGITFAGLNAEMEWDCWEEDDVEPPHQD
jgi:hypothetical protein